MKNYKLDFIKIDENNLVAGVGTAGNIWIVLNALLNINIKDKIYVDMTVEKTINTEKEEVNNATNPWEYYFEQMDIPSEFKLIDSVNLPSKLDYSERYQHSDKICNELKKSFFSHFQLKKDLQEEINEFYKEKIENIKTLGVQIRLTDMASSQDVKKLEHYIFRIKKILAENKEIKQVFLATDDQEVINKLKDELKVPIIYLNNIYRATKDKPDLLPYDRYEYSRPLHRYKLGKEVILDVFLLSKCNHILKADISCVSHLAVFFSGEIEKTHFLESKFSFIINRFKNRIKNKISKV